MDDIEDLDDAPQTLQFRPSPRFTTSASSKRVSTPRAQAPAQPQPPEPPLSASGSKSAEGSRFLDEIDPDLIAASLNPSKPAAKEKGKRKERKKSTPGNESSRLQSTSSVVGSRYSTSTSAQAQTTGQPQFRKPPTFSTRSTSRAAKTPQFQNTLELEPSSASASRASASRHVAQAEAATPTPMVGLQFRKPSRFQDEIDPDLLASATVAGKRKCRVNLSAPLRPVPAASAVVEDGPDLPLVTARRRRMPARETDSRVSTPTPAQEPEQSNLQNADSSVAGSRFQNILNLTASLSSSTTRRSTVSKTLNFKPQKPSEGKQKAAETPIRVSKRATAAYSEASLDKTPGVPEASAEAPGELQFDRPLASFAVVIPVRSASLNKRPRAQSSSPPNFIPDTPPPKRQQQEDQRQADTITLPRSGRYTGSGALTVVPDSEDEIEDSDSPAEPLRLSKPPQKRQILEIDSSPTQPSKQVRKKQKTFVEEDAIEDAIEDDPDSPLIPAKKRRIPYTIVPKRIFDASSSGDEVAEDIDAMARRDRLEALAPPAEAPPLSSQAPTDISQPRVSKPRPLMTLDSIRLRLRNPKPAPQPPLKPGMINILTHHKRLVIPRDPTPPPPSPPRRGYLERGLAETAMWWKHDSKELTLRSVFAEDKNKPAFRIVVKEFLRDGEMCIVKGLGENQDGKEGKVKAIVTDRIVGAIKKGLTLFYDRPWFPVTLFGEAEPYRFLVGRWYVRESEVKNPKKAKKGEEVGETEGGRKGRETKETEDTREAGEAGKAKEMEKAKSNGKGEEIKKTEKPKRTKGTRKANGMEKAEKVTIAEEMEEIREIDRGKGKEKEKVRNTKDIGEVEQTGKRRKPEQAKKAKETEQVEEREKAEKVKRVKQVERTEKTKRVKEAEQVEKAKKMEGMEVVEEGGKLGRAKRVKRTENTEKVKQTEKDGETKEVKKARKAEKTKRTKKKSKDVEMVE